ncbi:MAG TPA: trypsin-like peptidase domain-containing protein [Actinomycetota bacterium]|nr:trypsin-like peptidase domain-containing protein [Actinomycetota bacterium]
MSHPWEPEPESNEEPGPSDVDAIPSEGTDPSLGGESPGPDEEARPRGRLPWEHPPAAAESPPPAPAWWEGRDERPIRRVWDPQTAQWVPDEGSRPAPTEDAAWKRPALVGGLVGAIVSGLLVAGLLSVAGSRPTVIEQRAPALRGDGTAGDRVVAIAEGAKPSVVHINTTTTRTGVFGPQEARGAGSGVIIRSDGHIITNAHVVEGATAVEVVLASGEQLEGRLIGSDLDTDIAVVKVERPEMPAVPLGSSKDLRVGELTVAIGSPLGLSHSVTSGIVSALGRTSRSPSGAQLVDLIQTDASITRGNSGGALLNGQGALIGINSMIAVDPDVGAEGIGFAIPIDIARRVADDLIATGRATHPYIGVTGATIDAETARRFGGSAGARVTEVLPGGPADEAGIAPGDIIVRFGGEQVDSMTDLVSLIAVRRVGEEVPVELLRADGDGFTRTTVRVRVGDRPPLR